MTKSFYSKKSFFEKFKKSEIAIFGLSILSFFLCFENWFLEKSTKIWENWEVFKIENYFTAFDGIFSSLWYFIAFSMILSISFFILKILSNFFYDFVNKNSYIYLIFSSQSLLLSIITYFSYFSYIEINPFSKILFIIYFLIIIQMILFSLSIFFFLWNSKKNKNCFDLKINKYV